jgi:hypothetical protein
MRCTATTTAALVTLLPGGGSNLRNPYSQGTGSGIAWEDRAALSSAPAAVAGITSYADSSALTYNVKGQGTVQRLNLILSAGQ